MICSKIVNFDRKEASLTSKWSRILPTVQWCYQNLSNFTIQQCTTSPKTCYRHTYIHRHTHIHRDKATHRARLPSLKMKAVTISQFCHTRLHLRFSTKLKIWQVPACKMEPQSGKIMWRTPPTHPATHPPTNGLT